MLYNVGIQPYLPRVNFQNPLANKLVVDLSLSEGAGTVLHNSISNFNNFNLQGAKHWVKGNYGNSFAFAGGGDFAKTPAVVSTVVANFTLQAIVAQNSTTGEQEIFGNGNTFDGYYINLNGGTFSVLYPGVANISSVMSVTVGTIANLIVTRDATTTRFYLNGALGTATATNTPVTPTLQAAVGARGDNANAFKGTVFNSRMWTRCLSRQEIATLVENPWGLYRVPKNFNPNARFLPLND